MVSIRRIVRRGFRYLSIVIGIVFAIGTALVFSASMGRSGVRDGESSGVVADFVQGAFNFGLHGTATLFSGLVLALTAGIFGWGLTTVMGWCVLSLMPRRTSRSGYASRPISTAAPVTSCHEDASERSAKACLKAAMGGDVTARAEIAARYAMGDGVRRDAVYACAWSMLAAAAGDESANTLLTTLSATISSSDLSRARELSARLAAGSDA